MTDKDYELAKKVCLKVLNKHFNLCSKELKEDLFSEGMLKAFVMLGRNDFDPAKGSLENYLYTGVRNQMGNFLYHYNKVIISDPAVIESTSTSHASHGSVYTRDLLRDFLMDFGSHFFPENILDIFEQYDFDFDSIIDVYPFLRKIIVLFTWEVLNER